MADREADPGPPPILSDVLEDLAVRFVVNCPAEEQESFERLLFQVEAAFWFFEDEYREIWPHAFPALNLLGFAQKLFQECVLLAPFAPKAKEIYERFTQYKNSIPTCGAIILNPNNTKCILVKSWNGKSWGFPKGKIDKDEDKADCAIREVHEEVGFDISPYLVAEHYVERQLAQQTVRLYIIRGVPDNTHFVTQTKKEIGAIEWHNLKELPDNQHLTDGQKKFWMVWPFVERLKPWLVREEKKAKKAARAAKAAAPAAAPPKAQAQAQQQQETKGKKADKGRGDKKAQQQQASQPQQQQQQQQQQPVQVLQRPEAAAPRRPSRGHAFLDFEFGSNAVLSALG
tara:strand:- start:105 stop:1133 length:1029 start_codon:yes stop_codon:yes gene_type:complete